jgi:hypothetical protein
LRKRAVLGLFLFSPKNSHLVWSPVISDATQQSLIARWVGYLTNYRLAPFLAPFFYRILKYSKSERKELAPQTHQTAVRPSPTTTPAAYFDTSIPDYQNEAKGHKRLQWRLNI